MRLSWPALVLTILSSALALGTGSVAARAQSLFEGWDAAKIEKHRKRGKKKIGAKLSRWPRPARGWSTSASGARAPARSGSSAGVETESEVPRTTTLTSQPWISSCVDGAVIWREL